jgi:hypothetical protein
VKSVEIQSTVLIEFFCFRKKRGWNRGKKEGGVGEGREGEEGGSRQGR